MPEELNMAATQYVPMPVLATPFGYVPFPMGAFPAPAPAFHPNMGWGQPEMAMSERSTPPQSPTSGVLLESLLPGGCRTSRTPNGRKVFVGGLNPTTDADGLRQYFSQFGKVVDSSVVTDSGSKASRGFGFVQFEDELPPGLLSRQHVIDNRRCGVREYGHSTRPETQ
jgi:hypothetical protein